MGRGGPPMTGAPSTRPRLTPHQNEVYLRLIRHATRAGSATRHVRESEIGSFGALRKLEAKGYAVIAYTEIGPRGGVTYYWLPVL